MIKTEHSSLRTRLRSDTRVSHNDLDRKVSQFDLTTPFGFVSFLHMQSAALRSIAPRAERSDAKEGISDLLSRAESDLRAIGASHDVGTMDIGPLHPLAIDYVIAGSRLGTQVLRKRWRATKDPNVRHADAYFSAPNYIEIWKSFCGASDRLSAVGEIADQIVGDADLIFKLYHTCAHAAHSKKGTVDA